MGAVTIAGMFDQILVELDIARNALSEAASWARSDWSERRSLTPTESAARDAVFAAVEQGKTAIDDAKHAIYDIKRIGHSNG